MPRIAPSIHASWGQLSDAELAAYEERAAAEEGMLGPPGCEYEKLFKVGPGTGGPGTGGLGPGGLGPGGLGPGLGPALR
jgi:hypothetical protein